MRHPRTPQHRTIADSRCGHTLTPIATTAGSSTAGPDHGRASYDNDERGAALRTVSSD
jgi:hypothetical protein